MFDEQCFERLRAKLPPAYIATRVFKVAMLGESLVDSRVAPIYKRYSDVQTTILAGAGDIQFNLFTRADSMEAAQQRVDDLAGEIEDELGDALYASKGESLEQIVGYYLQMRDSTLAVAESCTGWPARRPHYQRQRKFPVLFGRGNRLLERIENRLR